MNPGMTMEQANLYHDIGVIGFVVVELNEYLDTHPTDREAMEYFNHYTRMKEQAMRDYAAKYGPLTLAHADNCGKEWKWATQPMPWEGVC